MLITALLDLVVAFVHAVLYPFRIGDIPFEVVQVFDSVMQYVVDGAKVVACYTHWQYLCVLLDFVLLLEAFHTCYIVFVWIIKKIPIWSIS